MSWGCRAAEGSDPGRLRPPRGRGRGRGRGGAACGAAFPPPGGDTAGGRSRPASPLAEAPASLIGRHGVGPAPARQVRAEPRGFNEPPGAVPLAAARGRLRRGSSARDGAAGAGTGGDCGGSPLPERVPGCRGRLLPGPGPVCGRSGGPAVPLLMQFISWCIQAAVYQSPVCACQPQVTALPIGVPDPAVSQRSPGLVLGSEAIVLNKTFFFSSKRAAVGAEAAPGTRTGSCSPVGEAVKPAWPGPGSDGRAGASGGVGGPGGRRPCPVRDTRTDGGAPARPGAARGGCGAPGRSRAACAEADAAACPAPAWGQPGLHLPGDPAGTALLQPGCGSRSSSWTAPVQFWLQLLFVAALLSSPAYGWLQCICSFRLVVSACFVSVPAPGRLQFVTGHCLCTRSFWVQLIGGSCFLTAPARLLLQGWMFLPPFCSCTAPAWLRLQLIVFAPLFFRSSSWMATLQFWLQLVSSSSAASSPADAQFQSGCSSSSWMVPASAPPRVHLQLNKAYSSSNEPGF
ncbi:collagen, type I, alpha 1b-like [Nyctibius grandis]|uniref:collagen, type I, alpha 1b-like n=1 Tax=Nyctibius grandis TaxID=48427 RepID=UPI0035BC1CFB